MVNKEILHKAFINACDAGDIIYDLMNRVETLFGADAPITRILCEAGDKLMLSNEIHYDIVGNSCEELTADDLLTWAKAEEEE